MLQDPSAASRAQVGRLLGRRLETERIALAGRTDAVPDSENGDGTAEGENR